MSRWQSTTRLLNAIAGGDTSAVSEYDALLFPVLRDVALRRGRFMAADVAAQLGVEHTSAQAVRSADLEEVAVVAAEMALQRARASALRFDEARGDGASWALGALGHAYLDAVRAVTGSRRLLIEIPATDEALDSRSELEQADPHAQTEAKDALQYALGALTDDERLVVIARLHYGMSYREIAAYRFHDETQTKRVDRLLQSARGKLHVAHEAWVEGS